MTRKQARQPPVPTQPRQLALRGRNADKLERLDGVRTGQLLIDALQASPHREIELAPQRFVMPVRDVAL